MAPGLLLAAGGAAAARLIAGWWAPLSPLVVAIVLGMVVANVWSLPRSLLGGLRVGSRSVLRTGVVLLGLRLVFGDLLELGAASVVMVVAVATATVIGVILLGRVLGVRRDLGLLTGTGFAICGATAVAAAQGTLDADEEDVAAALGLVLIFGTASIAVLPTVSSWLGLGPEVSGAWIGAAVHDVGQVVAAAELVGGGALETAMLVKLTRVLLLGPLLMALSVVSRRRLATTDGIVALRRPTMPLFVAGFVLMVAVRSSGVVPAAVIDAVGIIERACFAIALFSLGTEVRARRLRTVGVRPLVLGLVSWASIVLMGLLGSVVVLGSS